MDSPHPATLGALVLFTLVSLGLGVLANVAARGKAGFLREYFLGNRSLGPFAVALTAAVMSGGTFLGFPSLVYRYGWVVGLWICSYMVAPLTTLGVLGKRIGHIARRTGAITLPDFFRERYGSPALGLLTSLFVILFLGAFLVAQFKAGGVLMKIVLPSSTYRWGGLEEIGGVLGPGYVVGLVVFAATVVAYTAYGGFLAAVWTDVFQSIVMAIGVLILLPLALVKAGGLEAATYKGMALAGDGFAFGPGAGRAFHPIGLAVSFFVMWAITGMGQPSTIVRLMAFRDSRTLRYSMMYLSIYNIVVYIPLIVIFVCARGILPDLGKSSDEAMPRLVTTLANPYLAGLILAAPYGAVMSTVSGFLLIISSALVRDVYQRFVRPSAGERELAGASYAATVGAGVAVALLALRPPEFLQLIVIFASAGLAASFLVPALLGAFWRRANAAGAIAAMVAGGGVTLALYAYGSYLGIKGVDQGIGPPASRFGPYYLLGLEPAAWGLLASLVAGVVVSLLTPPPDPRLVSLLFDAQPPDAPAPATLDPHPETAS